MKLLNIFKKGRREAAQASYAPVKEYKDTQYVKIVRLLSERKRISPADCLRYPCITTKLSTRIGEIEDRTGIVFKRERDPETRFMTYSCFTTEDLVTLCETYLPECNPLNPLK